MWLEAPTSLGGRNGPMRLTLLICRRVPSNSRRTHGSGRPPIGSLPPGRPSLGCHPVPSVVIPIGSLPPGRPSLSCHLVPSVVIPSVARDLLCSRVTQTLILPVFICLRALWRSSNLYHPCFQFIARSFAKVPGVGGYKSPAARIHLALNDSGWQISGIGDLCGSRLQPRHKAHRINAALAADAYRCTA